MQHILPAETRGNGRYADPGDRSILKDAECRSFLEFLEDNLPCTECVAAINDTCQLEEAFMNFIKGISDGDLGMTRRQYA